MKGLYTLLAIMFLFSANLKGQTYTYLYNPYSRMNEAQLNLALEQAEKSKRNGMVWTTVGAGMMVGGGILTYKGINDLVSSETYEIGSFLTGMGVMCFGAFPLTFGFVSWLTGNEEIDQIEIELLAFDTGTLDFKPTPNGLGLVLAF